MNEATTRVHMLSNGSFCVLVTERGGGYSALNGFALTRWEPDPSFDVGGPFLYVRDIESGRFWSVTEAPCAPAGAAGSVRCSADVIETAAQCDGILATQQITVAGGVNAEVRKIRLTNEGDVRRRLDVTTYAELALNNPAGVAGHPAFSKLFVQTGWDAARSALIAWRRPRSPEDQPLWVAQRLLHDGTSADVSFETDRVAAIGRRRSTADPVMLTQDALGGTTGTVLDPVFCLRASVALDAGGHADLELVTYAAASREELEVMLDTMPTPKSVARAHAPDGILPAAAAVHAMETVATLGLPASWLEGIAFEPFARDWKGTHARGSTREGEPKAVDYGRFSDDGRAYILPVGGGTAPTPQPWINVLANESFGCLVSETGAGYTWAANSRENRLTPWSNDPVTDPHSEMLFIRDDQTGELWSPLPGAASADGAFEVTHGFGYSRFTSSERGLRQDVTIFVPRADPVRIALIRLVNEGDESLSLSLFSFAALVLGTGAPEARPHVVTEVDATGTIHAHNRQRGEFSSRSAFAFCCGRPVESATGSRPSFLASCAPDGPGASSAKLDGRFGEGLDPCAALHVCATVPPNAMIECAFILGEAGSRADAEACVRRYAHVEDAHAALEEVTTFWAELLSAVEVETPEPAVNLMLNGWLAYQNLACRMWARSAFFQSGGAFGFRDQLQDSSALVYYDPAITRAQILLHAAHQFAEGDVLHWWHPPLSKGIRTHFRDDLLWLPYITLFYIARTGDSAILNEAVRFITSRTLADGEDEIFVVPEDSGESGSVYEHCCRALDRSLARGAHGLPLMGTGDWNDGMNRVGREGRGESVWLGFFMFDILHDFLPLCDARGDVKRAAAYRAYLDELHEALHTSGWDGGWYRRAYYDNGAPLGSSESDECRIDTLAQAWAVISRAAPAERARMSLDAMRDQLIMQDEGIIRLLTPAFDKTPHDPGYIKGYVPGVRENGGQYTHAAIWAVRAVAETGDTRAAELLAMITPVRHTASTDRIERYGGEPYVVAADVYSVAPHIGRAGWTWYTGSAGWMGRVALESILGFNLEGGDTIRLCPCIPPEWNGFRLAYRFSDGTRYVFDVARAAATMTSHGAVKDGSIVIPVTQDGASHDVRIALGPDIGPVYAPRSRA